MAVDDQAIRDFVAANIDNPQAIASAAQANGVSVEQIASAMQLPTESVNSYFTSANVPPPLTFKSSNTGGAVGQATGQASAGQINQITAQAPNLVNAIQSGTALLNYDDTGVPQLVDKTTGQSLSGYEYIQTRPDGNIQVNISDGRGGYVSAVTTVNQEGTLAPVSSGNVYTATKAAPDKNIIPTLVGIGLAYALPIIGEAIAAELAVSTSVGTALAAIGTGVAQGKSIEDSITSAAPALIAGGIMSQLEIGNLVGQISTDPNLQNAINNVANSTASTALKGGGIQDIVRNAVATGGGTLIGQSLTPDLGTYGASIVGQGLATGAVTGSGLAGLTASAGTAGGLQATQNSYMRDIDNVLNSQASGVTPQKVSLDFVDLSQGTQVAGPGGLPNDGFKPGQMTQTATGLFTTLRLSDGSIVNVPVQYNQGSNSLTTNSTNPEIVNQVKLLKITPENITKINPVFLDKTPVNPNISAQEQAELNKVSSASQNMINALKQGKSIDEYYNTYSYNQSLNTFANQIAEELAKDTTGVDPSYDKMRAEYQKITGIPFNIASPATDLGEIIVTGKVIKSDPTTNTSTIQTPDGVTINVNSVLPKDSSVAVNKTTSAVIPTSVTNQTSNTDTSPVSKVDTSVAPTSNVATSNVSNVKIVVNTDPANNTALVTDATGNVTIVNTGGLNVTNGQSVVVNTTSNTISNVATTTTTPTTNLATGNVTISSSNANNAANISSNVKTNVSSNIAQDIVNLLSSNVVSNVASNVASNVTTNTAPGNVTITPGGGGGGGNNVGNVVITGGGGNNVSNNIANISNVTITGGTTNNIATVISPTPSANVTITGGGANNAVSNVSDNNVSITTSYVAPPPLKASYPTIVGQFASPLTQAISAYRPPGELESQATGKEREDVWNAESLRNALGI